MEEEQMHKYPIPATHILQQTLRSFCNIRNSSQWVYAVFWRILPRIYPPPKWDGHGGAYDRSRGNRRNWILVWEDGFCNFGSSGAEMINGDGDCAAGSSVYGNCEYQHYQIGLQPELFFKMSHEVYNYGEGLIGKVAADHSHKWIYKEHNESQEIDFLSVWQNSADSHPRTWEAQFQSGIKTIALIAVREGVVQLGSLHKVMEDLNYVVLLREKFNYIESIPGVLLPHSSSPPPPPPYPFKINGYGAPESWHFQGSNPTPPIELSHHHFNQPAARITPSMSSLEALLSKLPAVVPPPPPPTMYAAYSEAAQPPQYLSPNRPFERMAAGMERVTKEEIDDEKDQMGESSNSIMTSYTQHPNFNSLHHHDH
ncbi:hypothetical protein RHGRI_033506 [Rhododendron griersonianum]|uniref:Transcription factor MYC/MYB N-terminal domain-containing protein n=1 Tax=Rhododendron griersonianum TaxID=479676 RepID=A0AAV6I055_9ERIC|nr:hypothetical protein RHGRI_033506 [Rhododendron griersonianum]